MGDRILEGLRSRVWAFEWEPWVQGPVLLHGMDRVVWAQLCNLSDSSFLDWSLSYGWPFIKQMERLNEIIHWNHLTKFPAHRKPTPLLLLWCPRSNRLPFCETGLSDWKMENEDEMVLLEGEGRGGGRNREQRGRGTSSQCNLVYPHDWLIVG